MRSFPVTLLALSALLLAGCGGDEPETTTPDGSTLGIPAGSLDHVDGTITLLEDGFQVEPETGEAVDLEFGPEVELAEVRAFEAAGTKARVSFRDGPDPLVAVAVQAAPELGEGLESYEGRVASITEREIVVDGSDGERTFTISAAAQPAFDVDHLEDHAAEDSPVRVYFDPAAPEAGIAYEDA